MKFSEEINEIASAMAMFQFEVESPKRSSANPAFKRDGKPLKYADLDAIIKVVSPALSKNGLSQMQFTKTDIENQTVSVKTLLLHKSGQFMESDELILPAESFGKFNAQTVGSAITYGRRYSLSAMLGIASEDDDDANAQSIGSENKQYNKNDYSKKKYDKPKVVPDKNNYDERESDLIKELDQNIQSFSNKSGMEINAIKEYVITTVNKSKGSKYETFEQVNKGFAIGTIKQLDMKFDEKQKAKQTETKQNELFEPMTTNPAEDIFNGGN